MKTNDLAGADPEGADLQISLDDIRLDLRQTGYHVSCVPTGDSAPARFVVAVARALGSLFVPAGCDPAMPIIRTAPTRAQRAAPFDRPEQIGWHGDFATYEERPEISIVYITRPDPGGGDFGAWRLASVVRVFAALRATDEGQAAFDLLSRQRVPFSYAAGEAPRWFTVVERGLNNSEGLRFYLSSIRHGCVAAYGEVPPELAGALSALERAASQVGEVVPTYEGSLLIASNWLALHDRVRQTTSRTQPNREALLCFVARPHEGAFVPSLRIDAPT